MLVYSNTQEQYKMDAINTHQLHGIALFLVKNKLLHHNDAVIHLKNAQENNQPLLCYLVHHNIVCSKTVALKLSQQFDLPLFDLNTVTIESLPALWINNQFIQRYFIVPLFTKQNQLYVATNDPFQHTSLKELQFQAEQCVCPLLVDTLQLTQLIAQLLKKEESKELTSFSSDIQETNNSSFDPIVKFVERILLDAVKQNASDIHFEPYEHDYQIRYRQDGLLSLIATPPLNLANRIACRIKILANLDIAERRVPQDGHFKLEHSLANTIDFRVSSCPTIGGEKIVVRLLHNDLAKANIESLGFLLSQKNCFLSAISKPQGLILVTGPTGSGKTLTLYSALNNLNTGEKNISTAEDPVEMTIHGINQVQINVKAGLTFANTLRALLRQDPDVIMLGEIRDLETAEIAIKAAQTGHLVLSTLHTNSAHETLTRFFNMGVASVNIASSIRLIIAQRLVRLLCPFCKVLCTDSTFGKNIYQAVGCNRCTHGYRGRQALFEMMPISKTLAQMIIAGENEFNLLNQAKKEGMTTLFDASFELVKAGITSFEEIHRVMIE